LLSTLFQENIAIAVIPLNISTDREVPSVKKELSLIALGIIAAAPAFASQQSASQGFIDDSHLDLFLRNAYIKRDYRDGLPDKAEWGQGLSPPSHPALPRAGRLWRGRYRPVRGAP
jgi:hypothetical protein